MVLVSHPTGNANVRNLLVGLEECGLLAEFHTTIAAFSIGSGAALSRLPFMSGIKRREYPDCLQSMTRCHPFRESVRLLSIQAGMWHLLKNEAGWASIESVIRSLDSAVAYRVRTGIAGGVYAYEDGALETFQAARDAALPRIYEHPVGYWRLVQRLMQEEAEREPEWARSIRGLSDSAGKRQRKDAELGLATRVVVASSFSRKSLEMFPGELAPVSVVPYGAPSPAPSGRQVKHSDAQALRVLFVGGLGQMKGLSYLFSAVSMLGRSVDLTVIGRKPVNGVPALERALKAARWIETLPNQEILRQMQAHDVLVFPSLSEGFGMVITEALSQGLPVITTSHTCGPDVLSEGEDGFIVPIRDPQAIAEKLELLHRDRGRLAAMSEAARKKAESLTWESYRKGVVAVVREVLGEGGKGES
jgi:starch synthase